MLQNIKDFFSLIGFSRFILLVAVFIVPFVFYPNSKYFFGNLKTGIFFGVSLLAMLLWSISRLKKDSFKFPVNLISLSILLIILTSIISSVFSENPFVSIFGVNLSVYSSVGLMILFSSTLLIGSLFESKKGSYVLTIVTYVSLSLTLFVNLLYILVASLPDFGFFVFNSVNTIGKWSDIGVISAFVVVISYLIIETQKHKSYLKIFAWFSLIMSGLFALIVSEVVTWISLGVVSIFYLVYKIVVSRQESVEKINKNLPYTTITVFLVSFVMILTGNLMSSFTDAWLGINFSETKPGIQSTIELTGNVISQKPFFGVGENRFERAWQLYKPDNILLTNYAGADFNFGYSYFSSIPAKVGLLGFLSWLLFIVMMVWNSIKLLFKKTDDLISHKLNLIHSFSVLFLILVLFIHVPSVVVLFVFFIFTGLFVGSLSRNGLYKSVEVSVEDSPKKGFLFIFSIVVLMILSTYLGYMSSRQFVSTIMLEKAKYNLNSGDLPSTQKNIINSVNLLMTDSNLSALSEYYRIEISRLLQTQDLNNQGTIDSFKELLGNSRNAAGAAINFDRSNYRNYVSMADLYAQLSALKFEGAYEEAITFYSKARETNPRNPLLFVSMARTGFAANKNDEAKKYIEEALKIKPNFVDAIFLLSQIQASEGDTVNAIKNVGDLISVEPNNSNLYFQLGLLRYNDKNFGGAISSFEKAVIIQPYFANAKYFLGLSYEKNGRHNDAILQFEDLKTLNPDNEEIKTILNKLKSGGDIFSGLENQIEPEKREELPLEETVESEE